MSIFELMKRTNSHEVSFFEEPSVGLRAIVVVDNTVLGPALASCRLFNYKTEEDAINDALNIASYNTYRSASLRKDFGGGSIVLYGDPKRIKSEMYFRALGIFLNKLNGKLFLAAGSGISATDILDIHRESNYLLGLNEKFKETGKTAVHSTAKGIIYGMKAAVKELMDKGSLEGLTIAVQGVGEIGSQLVENLLNEKANIVITDAVYDKIKVIQDRVPNITVVKPDEIYKTKCDIFCSCAYEGLVTKKNVDLLNCKILTGSVNNVIGDEEVYETLTAKKILYVPGFLINGGDIIQFSAELSGFDFKIEKELYDIYHNTLSVLRTASSTKRPVNEVALEIAKDYINSVAAIKMLK